jgi:hypothetical protein
MTGDDDPTASREIELFPPVVLADVTGDGRPDFFVPLMCTNGGGTAGGQTGFAVQVYSGAARQHLIGLLRPTQTDATGEVHVPYMDALTIRVNGRRVTATELWYSAGDSNCCPSIRVRTSWAYRDGAFHHERSSEPRQVRAAE